MSLESAISDLRRKAERSIAAAARVLDEANRQILSTPAPLVLTSGGRLRAATPATAGAPPRTVTGRLLVHATSYEVEPGRWYVGVFAVPYAWRLEMDMNHPYVSVTLSEHRAAMEDAAAAAARQGGG